MKFIQALNSEKIKNLTHRRSVTIEKKTKFSEIVRLLQEARTGCAVILEDGKVAGILTERDILKRGLLANVGPNTPAEQLMTPEPKVLDMEDNLSVAVRMMHDGKYRHLPIIDREGKFLGLVSVRDIVFYLSELYPYEVFNQPPDPHQVSVSPEGA